MTWRRTPRAAIAALLLAAAVPARAQFWRAPKHGGSDVPPADLEGVGVEERLGAAVPLDVPLVDSTGRAVKLGDFFDGKRPVVLALVYYDCPMLCGLVLSGLARSIRENGLGLGRDYQALAISFDPAERPGLAAERRRGYLQSVGLDEAGGAWPFLVGKGEDTRRLADALGFHYRYDARNREWAHIAAVFVLTPDGKASRYLYGIEYPPKELRLSLVEAAGGRVGTSFDRFLLTCYRYDPASRKYEPYAWGVVRAGALAVLLALTGLIAGLVLRERRAAKGKGAKP